MVRRIIATALVVSGVLSSIAVAQDVGSNAYIDMYFNDGHASAPVVTHGTLEERNIFARGDALKPTEKGAVLRYINSFSSAITRPSVIDGAHSSGWKAGDLLFPVGPRNHGGRRRDSQDRLEHCHPDAGQSQLYA